MKTKFLLFFFWTAFVVPVYALPGPEISCEVAPAVANGDGAVFPRVDNTPLTEVFSQLRAFLGFPYTGTDVCVTSRLMHSDIALGTMSDIRQGTTLQTRAFIDLTEEHADCVNGGSSTFTSQWTPQLICNRTLPVDISIAGPDRVAVGAPVRLTIKTVAAGAPVSTSVQVTHAGAQAPLDFTTDEKGLGQLTFVTPVVPGTTKVTANCVYCNKPAEKSVEAVGVPMCTPGDAGFTVGNPVVPATGSKVEAVMDWADQSPHPLNVLRRYSSHAASTSALIGKNWALPYFAELSGNALSKSVTDEGTIILFTRETDTAGWTNTAGDTLSEIAGGWAYASRDGEKRIEFSSDGKAKSLVQRNGWAYAIAYQNRAIQVTNAFGRTLQLVLDAAGRITAVGMPDGKSLQYTYDDRDRLIAVSYPDGKTRKYVYEAPALPNALTGIIDESGMRFASFEYDASGRVAVSKHAGDAQKYTFTRSFVDRDIAQIFVGNGTYFGTSGGVGVAITDPLGNTSHWNYSLLGGYATLSSSDVATRGSSTASREFIFDPVFGMLPSRETDFQGNVKGISWDNARRLETGRTEALGTPEQRSIDTQWHSQFRLPLKRTEPGRTTDYVYDSRGNLLSETVTDTSASPARTRARTWTYNAAGLVATQTEPNGATARYEYDTAGNLTQSTNAMGQVSRYTYDGAGRILSELSPTGLSTTFQYDARGQLVQLKRGPETTVFAYTPSGQLARVTQPSGQVLSYQYDAAHRLTGWSDNRGNAATYRLDGMGNRVEETVKDGAGTTAWNLVRTVNALNRVASVTVGGAAYSYEYDANGDLVRTVQNVGATQQATTLGLDALRRIKTLTDAQNATAQQQFNALDQLTGAQDFKGVATQYTRDAFGGAPQESSADAGTVQTLYDSLGLPQSVADALGRATVITRDLLGRPTRLQYADATATVLRYDLAGAAYNAAGVPNASLGFLSEVQDPRVTTRWQRDALGRIVAKTQVLANGDSRTVSYAYAPAGSAGAGQVASITYPSGKALQHQYDASGQLTGMLWNGQALLSGITWSALGQPKGWKWPAFALTEQRSYTSAGQLAASRLLPQLTWGSAGRLSKIQQRHALRGATAAQQVTLTSAHTYDATGRLTASAHSAPAGLALPSGWSLSDTVGANASGYAWDANGNRTQGHYSSTATAGTTTLQRDYQSLGNSNRLTGYTQTVKAPGTAAKTTSVAYTHDATGSLTKKGDSYLHYGPDGRIAKAGLNADPKNALAVSYSYNALSQRVFKSDARLSGANNPAITQQTVYAEDGIGSTVLGQYGNRRSSNSAAPAGEMDSTEVIYLPTASGPMPVAAQINGRLYAIDADHLNTPRRLTNTQGQVVWQWLITGFGEANPTTGATGYAQSGQGSANYSEAIKFDLRYPGQVWDEETGLAYNLNRYYDREGGRYFQFDPIGLEGGWNRAVYVEGNPLSYADPMGLQALPMPPVIPIPGVPNPTLDAQRDLADRLNRALRNDDETTYQTYTRYNPLTGDCYSGRTSGTDTPENNVRNRGYGQPLLNAEGFLPPVLDRSSTNYNAIRGREQLLIDVNGGARSSGGTSRNMINGISSFNPRGPFVYIPAATAEFGVPVPAGKCTCQ